jgi:hypothetical protein
MMDAETKKTMETGKMINRLREKKKKETVVLPTEALAVFKEFVLHSMKGKQPLLLSKKGKLAAVELACSFMKWAVEGNRFSLSDVCDYIPCLYDAVLEERVEVTVGIPLKRRLDDLKKGCQLLLEDRCGLIKSLKSESVFNKAWKELEETPDAPVPALPQDVYRLIKACGPTPHGQRMAAFMSAVFESGFSMTHW